LYSVAQVGPFNAASRCQIVAGDRPHSPASRCEQPVSDLVMRLLAERPDDRPSSSRQVARQLKALEAPPATGREASACSQHQQKASLSGGKPQKTPLWPRAVADGGDEQRVAEPRETEPTPRWGRRRTLP
jgi:hypothetical protein